MVTKLFIKSPVPGIDGVGGGEQRRAMEAERRETKSSHVPWEQY